jgi:DNA-binding NarL/FixJ family response regulator
MIPDEDQDIGLAGRRVLIVDDSVQVRRELRTLLPLAADIEIVGEAADGLEAVRLAQVLGPQVVLMDLEMPVLDGYEAAQQIKALCPSCRVIALTMYGDAASHERALQAGVDAFLVKGAPLEALVAAIVGSRLGLSDTPEDENGQAGKPVPRHSPRR